MNASNDLRNPLENGMTADVSNDLRSLLNWNNAMIVENGMAADVSNDLRILLNPQINDRDQKMSRSSREYDSLEKFKHETHQHDERPSCSSIIKGELLLFTQMLQEVCCYVVMLRQNS